MSDQGYYSTSLCPFCSKTHQNNLPCDLTPKVERHVPQMRIREAFAGMAMAAIAAATVALEDEDEDFTIALHEEIAAEAVSLADALIEELAK